MAEQQRAFRIEFASKEEIQREARWLSPELQEIADAMERVARGEHEAMRIVIEDKKLRGADGEAYQGSGMGALAERGGARDGDGRRGVARTTV